MIKKLFFPLILMPFLLHAQQIYDLKSCIEIGLKKNYDIRIMRNIQEINDHNATIGNAGYLPVIDLSSGYSGMWHNLNQQFLFDNEGVLSSNNSLNQAFNAGVYLNWTIFDGLKIQTTYQRFKELQSIGELNTLLMIENFMVEISAEYYNYIQQLIQLKNLRYALKLSGERLRIVEERYNIGSMSNLDLQQAKVDFNADSSRVIKQKEIFFASKVRLNQLMGFEEVDCDIFLADTAIIVIAEIFSKEQLWNKVMTQNKFLLLSEKNIQLSQLDLKSMKSANYPYLRLNAGYGYTHNFYTTGIYSRQQNLGFSYGATLGVTLFDGMNRSRQQKNAKIEIENKKLTYDNIVLQLRSDFANMWMAYHNNVSLWRLEKENLIVAEKNYEIAMERYLLGNLSGIELREAQNSLFEAEQRLVQTEYSIKICEISLIQISGQTGDLMQ